MRGGFWAVLMAVAVVCSSAAAHAQCSKDTDCKGERVCEAGQCVGAAPAPEPTDPKPEAEPAPHAAVSSEPPRESAPEPDVRFFDEDKPRKAKKRIGKPGMLVAGIVLASAAPIVLVVGVLTTSCHYSSLDSSSSGCDANARLLAFGLGAAALVGIGVPLIVIGAKRVPVRQVSIAPWLAPRQAGLQLHLAL